jgi:hypothetical protein
VAAISAQDSPGYLVGLRVYAIGDIAVKDIVSFLDSFNNAYSGALLLFEHWGVLQVTEQIDEDTGRPRPTRDTNLQRYLETQFRFITPEVWLRGQVALHERVILRAVRLESPGWWEFLGKLNPLEVLRQYLNDRHERAKDLDYRNELERERLRLETQILENRVIRERIEIAREVGVTDKDLRRAVNALLVDPLLRLGKCQDRGVISTAENVVAHPRSSTDRHLP